MSETESGESGLPSKIQNSASGPEVKSVKIAGFDAGNTQNQTIASGIGIQFKLAGNVSVPGDSLIGAGIVAMRENDTDSDSDSSTFTVNLGLYILVEIPLKGRCCVVYVMSMPLCN